MSLILNLSPEGWIGYRGEGPFSPIPFKNCSGRLSLRCYGTSKGRWFDIIMENFNFSTPPSETLKTRVNHRSDKTELYSCH